MRVRAGWLAALVLGVAGGPGFAAETLVGPAAFSDWTADAPGVRRLIRPQDMPQPGSERGSASAQIVPLKPEMKPQVPPGFEVALYASGLRNPRTIRVAPNGDIFVAESGAGRIRIFRPAAGSNTPSEDSIFAENLTYPYGIAFYPPGPDPQWVYVGHTGSVVRFPYKRGDIKASGPAQPVVSGIPTGGHGTRDIVFSADGKVLYVAVGSRSNVGEGMGPRKLEEVATLEAALGLGTAWDTEVGRAAVLAFAPEGGKGKLFATGIRNCSGLTLQKATGEIWCATNERDGLGDNVPSDYVTRVREGKFYGWPWYYIGDNVDPRRVGERPDLKGKVTVPDVLFQAHSAPLAITFYDGDAFPPEYRGDGFATMHGSWNRAKRTGYKVVRVVMKEGAPTGEYEDFMTGFVLADGSVIGRPVGVAVALDGALLVSEDGNDTIWRVSAKK